MTTNNGKSTERTSRTKFVLLVMLTAVGAAMLGGGIAWGIDLTGDEATTAGVIAGIGAAFMAAGGICAWFYRPNGPRWRADPAEPGKRDRLQAQRARQLAIFPALSLLFLAQAIGALEHVVEGQHRWVDYLRLAVPVLYAWVTAMMVMGWDGASRKNKRFLEDELTQSLRARALTLAFFVLLAGTTVSLGLGLWRAEIGVASLIFALAAAGAAAGLRFAWLFREAGRDDG
jgi:hypothetical protein